jgi:hypothetical protein
VSTTPWKCIGEQRHISTHSLTSVLDRGEWSPSLSCPYRPLYPHWITGWMGPRAVLDAVVKRKISIPSWEWNPRTPIVQPVAQRYTDWAITALRFPICRGETLNLCLTICSCIYKMSPIYTSCVSMQRFSNSLQQTRVIPTVIYYAFMKTALVTFSYFPKF